MENEITTKMIEACARAAHEVNRAYCIALGDTSQQSWDEAPEWQRTSAINGVKGALAGNTPEQSHESWLAEKKATGWKYGPVKDPDKKEHPCFVPYAELPPAQQHKDALFTTTVRAMAAALGIAAKQDDPAALVDLLREVVREAKVAEDGGDFILYVQDRLARWRS